MPTLLLLSFDELQSRRKSTAPGKPRFGSLDVRFAELGRPLHGVLAVANDHKYLEPGQGVNPDTAFGTVPLGHLLDPFLDLGGNLHPLSLLLESPTSETADVFVRQVPKFFCLEILQLTLVHDSSLVEIPLACYSYRESSTFTNAP